MALGSQEGLLKEVMVTGILKSGKELAVSTGGVRDAWAERIMSKVPGVRGGWQV